MTQYAIDDQHGTNICGGLDERRALDTAQEYADELGAPVLLYGDDGSEQTVPPSDDAPAIACRDYDPGAPHERMTR